MSDHPEWVLRVTRRRFPGYRQTRLHPVPSTVDPKVWAGWFCEQYPKARVELFPVAPHDPRLPK